ncbi:MAG: hypothetical protein JRG92_03150 [Deltaproteobacteria bacterium]|nr:hypothetical protein [Deltaproteobacteria bacterium]
MRIFLPLSRACHLPAGCGGLREGQLQKLEGLKQDGILDEREFAFAKAKRLD